MRAVKLQRVADVKRRSNIMPSIAEVGKLSGAALDRKPAECYNATYNDDDLDEERRR